LPSTMRTTLVFLSATLPLVVLSNPAAVEDEVTASDQLARFERLCVEEEAAANDLFLPPNSASEWYTVTIASVSVGYMHTTVANDESRVSTMELMDVQVSRGTDTSRMAFETVFHEVPLDEKDPIALSEGLALRGGVQIMAYDQRFANSEVRMNVSFVGEGISLTSHNGEKEHVTEVDLPEEAWMGRMRARLEFTRQCRQGKSEIVVRTMRPELGPKVIDLSSTFTGLGQIWDGEAFVEASLWTVRIHDVPVNMSEAYPTRGPLRCYRMLQLGLDMPFGYLLATLSTKEKAMLAAEDDPDRKLPELVYTMFVPVSKRISRVNDARLVRFLVKVRGSKGPMELKLPTAGYQRVSKVKGNPSQLKVTIDLQRPRAATEEELADQEYTFPSAMVDSSDTVIIELAHRIDARFQRAGYELGGRGNVIEKRLQLQVARSLRDLVHSHIESKHLSTAYASASETARTASGDCTEHAVLLAAVLKARKIPARVCHGLVYVEQGGSAIDGSVHDQAAVGAGGEVQVTEAIGQFGWHMWTQALINGKWFDFDATLHSGAYSVGHVLVGTSSMSDKEAHNNHMQMAALIGNLEMDLLEVRYSDGGR